MIHPYNATQIENITGLTLRNLPEGFEAEYETWLRMYHKTVSGGGQLPPSLLIPLLRKFDLGMKPDSVAPTRWDQMPTGTRVIAQVGGAGKKGKFIQIVSHGTLGVELEGDPRVREFMPRDVRIDKSFIQDINQLSMGDDREKPDARVTLLEDAPELLPKEWTEVSPGSPVRADGKDGTLVGPTPKKPGKLTVDVDGKLLEFTQDQVELIAPAEA